MDALNQSHKVRFHSKLPLRKPTRSRLPSVSHIFDNANYHLLPIGSAPEHPSKHTCGSGCSPARPEKQLPIRELSPDGECREMERPLVRTTVDAPRTTPIAVANRPHSSSDPSMPEGLFCYPLYRQKMQEQSCNFLILKSMELSFTKENIQYQAEHLEYDPVYRN
jgi:hypothetical protein